MSAIPEIYAMAAEFPAVENHPNRVPFTGVLTLLDTPSDGCPSGSRGHRMVLPRAAAEKSLPSLLGMAVDYKPDWDGHDARNKIGIITHASIEGVELKIGGYLYARDFPEVIVSLRKESESGRMGMSYEMANCGIRDMRASVWEATHFAFTGAAILLREKAAYKQTQFSLQ